LPLSHPRYKNSSRNFHRSCIPAPPLPSRSKVSYITLTQVAPPPCSPRPRRLDRRNTASPKKNSLPWRKQVLFAAQTRLGRLRCIWTLHRVSPPTSGRQQRHLSFPNTPTSLCMYQVRLTWWRTHCPARRRPPPGPAGSAQPSPTGRPRISRTWPSARSLPTGTDSPFPPRAAHRHTEDRRPRPHRRLIHRNFPPAGAQGPSAIGFRTPPGLG
jgi:hypothetical protein